MLVVLDAVDGPPDTFLMPPGSAVTNLDLHDVARTVMTYGLAEYLVATPVASQREKIARIVGTWSTQLAGVDNRRDALATVTATPSIAQALERVRQRTNAEPFVVATSARGGDNRISIEALTKERLATTRPLVLLFGTGWGLEETVISESNQVLEPVEGHGPFNHLSVRSAVAVVCDRIFGVRS